MIQIIIFVKSHSQELNPAPSAFTIYLGWQTQGGPNPNQVKCKVVQIIIHPDYRDALRNNSVALMKLSSPVTFSNYIRPICLASSSSRFSNNTLCWATGWERLNFTGEYWTGLLTQSTHTVCPLWAKRTNPLQNYRPTAWKSWDCHQYSKTVPSALRAAGSILAVIGQDRLYPRHAASSS